MKLEGIGDKMNQKNCQFYIILGDKNFTGKNDGNVYINATGANDIQLINKAIFNAFHKKREEGVSVANQIIFLIPEPTPEFAFEEQCQMLMDKLNLVGKIQYLPKSQNLTPKVPVMPKEQEAEPEKPNSEINSPVHPLIKDPEIVSEEDPISQDTEQAPSKNISYQPKDNIYRGDIESPMANKKYNTKGPIEEMYAKDSASYMGYNPTLINNNVKNLVRKANQNKKAAFVTLPVIIFILSALLLIASIIILFVLD